MNISLSLAALILAGTILSACNRQGGTAANPDADYYTCTMHPSVHSHDPNAKCPICSMDLVPVMKKGAASALTGGSTNTPEIKTVEGIQAETQTSTFMVPVERQQQIGVTYAAAEKRRLHRLIRTVGMVAPDKTRHWEFVARVEGYVQKLNVTSPGELIEINQPLLSIYSPELLTTEYEFINLLETRDRAATPEGKAGNERLLAAARYRMEQWNVTPQQIADLEKSRKPSEFITLYSPFKGVVEDVPVDQGRKVMPGDHLVDVADLSVVWVWAEFYEDEISLLEKGQRVSVTAAAYPGRRFDGGLALINPFLNEMKRTAKVRIDIANSDFALRPGMYVNIELAVDAGEGLTIPVSAVMPTGSRTLVFVDKGGGRIEPRFIQLGGKFGDFYKVQSGLKDHERVVASANFLIDAESKVQGAVKSFEEPGKPAAMQPMSAPLPKEAAGLYQPVIASYLAIEKLLVQDKLDGVPQAVAQLRERVQVVAKSTAKPDARAEEYQKHVASIATELEQFKTGSLAEARISFGKVSAVLIATLTEFPSPLESTVYVMNCPMWEKSPANWLQITNAIANPFMGVKMADCGDVVKTLEVKK